MSDLGPGKPVDASWLAAMLRNYIENDDVFRNNGAKIVQVARDPLTLYVFQPGGEHLMVQVNPCEVVVR